MYTVKEYYEEVKLRGTKSGKCQCGKRLTRSTTFSQTLNPYNKVGDRLKTRTEIMQELNIDRDVWKLEPVHCAIPSYWQWTSEQREEYNTTGKVVIEAVCGAKVLRQKKV